MELNYTIRHQKAATRDEFITGKSSKDFQINNMQVKEPIMEQVIQQDVLFNPTKKSLSKCHKDQYFEMGSCR